MNAILNGMHAKLEKEDIRFYDDKIVELKVIVKIIFSYKITLLKK